MSGVGYKIVCGQCGIQTPAASNSDAIAAWNRRPSAEAASKMLGALEAADDRIKSAINALRSYRHASVCAKELATVLDEQINAIEFAKAAGIKSPLPEPQSGEHP